MERIFGIEKEYAFSLQAPNQPASDPDAAVERFVNFLRSRLPHLPGNDSSGVFLASGGRLYRDRHRLEITTPETTHFRDTCRYLQAADRIVAREAEAYAAQWAGPVDVVITGCNVCYSGSHAVSGCHESYGYRNHAEEMPAQLIPFLASRIVLSGAGGFNNLGRGIEFCLSPRVCHLATEVSDSSTGNRGIFHQKHEPLCRGWERLHVLTGESLSSETGTCIEVGATAAVVALIDAGLRPGDSVPLCEPLRAMRLFNTDVACKARAVMTDGRWMTALEIQTRYLDTVEQNAARSFMPPWTAELCRAWRGILDRLRQGYAGVQRTLDWAIKYALYTRHLQRHGFTWDLVRRWNAALDRCAKRVPVPDDTADDMADDPMLQRLLALEENGPAAPADPHSFLPFFRRCGLDVAQLDPLLKVRDELFELDTRFGAVGQRGLFASLDRAGLLDHHFAGVERIEEAMTQPPGSGRARLRGMCVQRFAGHGHEFAADWSGVWDFRRRKMLNLSDPFTSEENWQDMPPVSPGAAEFDAHARMLLHYIEEEYEAGQYESAYRAVELLHRRFFSVPGSVHDVLDRYCAWIQARRGYLDGMDYLGPDVPEDDSTLSEVIDCLCVYRFEGLAPVHQEELEQWIARGLELVARQPAGPAEGLEALLFREHYGAVLLRQGRVDQSLAELEKVRQGEQQLPPRIRARLRALLGETQRLLGRSLAAALHFRKARAIQARYGFRGDLADFTLTGLAKCTRRPRRALALLAEAKSIQTAGSNMVGEVRTLLLEARLGDDPAAIAAARTRVEALRTSLPALGVCGLLGSILDNWEAWTSGGRPPVPHPDPFWGV